MIGIFAYVLFCLVALAVVLIFLGIAVYRAAEKNAYATTLRSSTFKFLVKGGKCYKILEDLQDAFVDQKTFRVIDGEPSKHQDAQKREIGLLERWFGIIWISIFYPAKKVHMFDVVVDKLKPGQENLPIRDRVQEGVREVGYLLYRFPHPILIKDVELGKGNWRVDVLAVPNMRVVCPFTVVFDFEGTVMRQIDAAVRASVIDYLSHPDMDYAQLIAEKKGADSDMAKAILKLNESTTPTDETDGIGIRFGVEIESVPIEAVDLTPDSKKQQEAAQAVETQRLLADAKIEEARGNKVAAKLLREGEGQGLKSKMKSLTDRGLTAKEAADVIRDEIKYSNIKGSNLTTYVEGGDVVRTMPIK